MTVGLWQEKGIPRKNWKYVDCEDLEEPSFSCEMCKTELRYVHELKHESYPKNIFVGCICLQKLCQESLQAKKNETRLKNESKRRENFVNKGWKISQKGNSYRKIFDVLVIIFERQKIFKISIDNSIEENRFESEIEAKKFVFMMKEAGLIS